MVFKLLALACVVAVVCANPTPCHGTEIIAGGTPGVVQGGGLGGVGGLVGGILNAAGGLVGNVLGAANGIVGGVLGGGKVNADASINLGLNLAGLLQALTGGLTDLTGNAGSILGDLAKLKIPGTVDDIFNLVIGLGATIGGVLNVVLPGSGTSVSNLILGLMKIFICGLGSPGLTGTLLADRRPGYNNPSDIPAICRPDYGVKYGLKPYDGDNSIDGIYNFYNLGDIDNLLRSLIEKKTNGQGVDYYKGCEGSALKWLLEISHLLKSRRQNNKWSDEDTFTVIINITKILGLIGNSYKRDLGTRIVNEIIQYIKTTSKKSSSFKNYDWKQCESKILEEISDYYYSTFGGALKQQSEDDYTKVKNEGHTTYNYGDDENFIQNNEKNDESSNTDEGQTLENTQEEQTQEQSQEELRQQEQIQQQRQQQQRQEQKSREQLQKQSSKNEQSLETAEEQSQQQNQNVQYTKYGQDGQEGATQVVDGGAVIVSSEPCDSSDLQSGTSGYNYISNSGSASSKKTSTIAKQSSESQSLNSDQYNYSGQSS